MKTIYKDFEIVVMGDSGTGKTSIIYKYAGKKLKDIKKTLFVDCIPKIVEKKTHTSIYDIWDTPGKEEDYNTAKGFIKIYFDGCVLVYDVSNENSFNNLEKWYTEAKRVLLKDAPIILIGNKNDLPKKDKIVKGNLVQEKVKKFNTKFFLTSVNKKKTINNAFESLVTEMKNKFESERKESSRYSYSSLNDENYNNFYANEDMNNFIHNKDNDFRNNSLDSDFDDSDNGRKNNKLNKNGCKCKCNIF